MKTENAKSSATLTKSEPSKLVSLLALATGVVAMPQTGNADIIYSNQGGTVSWDGTRSFVINNLPGNAQLGFAAHRVGSFSFTSVRSVTVGKRGNGYVELKLALVSQTGVLWGQIGASMASAARLGTAQSTHDSGGFGNVYMAFEFRDSSQAGNPMRYGWVGISLSNGSTGGGIFDYPALTISGWAYDTTGAQIPMGATAAVPEPGSVELLVLGALTLGAQGVRSWRRNRAASGQA
jgi:hypothetical protein